MTATVDVDALTPVQRVGSVWLKRDDLCEVAGVRGGKVRTCWQLAQGAKGLVTAGSRSSPQVNIVAHIARELGVPCRVHVPQGELAPEVYAAAMAGAVVVQHPAGYNSVIVARARADAAERGWKEIPFGMECEEAVAATARQVRNLPWGEFDHIVVPVGSGMSLAGILTGLEQQGQQLTPVVGVCVGADPTGRLLRWAPLGWQPRPVTLVQASTPYHHAVDNLFIGDVLLDPIYEAKAAAYVGPRDLLWLVGIRQTALK